MRTYPASAERGLVVERRLTWIRLGILAMITGMLPLMIDVERYSIARAYGVLLFAWPYFLYLHIWQPQWRSPGRLVTYTITTIDTLILSLVIVTTGAAESPYFVMCFPAIVAIGLRHGAVVTHAMALLCAGFTLAGAAAYGQFESVGMQLAWQIVAIVLTAIVTTALTAEIYDNAASLRSSNAQLQQEAREREAAQLALAKAAKRKDEFLAMLAHELRNPLSPIAHALALMDGDGPELGNRREVTAMMRRQVGHMTRMVDDLLDVARVTRGKVHLARAVVKVETLVTSSLEASVAELKANGVHVAYRPSRQPLYVNVDATRIEQVLTNLIRNAAKYSKPEGGILTISVSTNGAAVVIDLRDDGIGMEPEFVERAFELFAQADVSLDRARGGLGIGLTLVKKVIELHGGTVEAASPGLDQGSSFRVSLPLVERPVMQRTAPRPRIVDGPRRILLVEDNADVAYYLSLLLKRWGHTIDIEHDGGQAIAAARRLTPDLVILDIGLPGMSGYEIARTLRQEQAFSSTLLVAITGYGGDDTKQAAIAAGFDFHLTKPVDATLLADLFGRSAPDEIGGRA